MSSSPARVRVLRGATVAAADLGTVRSSAARDLVIAPELIDAAQREGFQQGYEAGAEAGYTDAMNQARQQNADLSARLAEVIRRLGEAAEALYVREGTARYEIENQVVDSAFEIAQVLVGHELRNSENVGRDALARALHYAPDSGHVVARLHPDDLVTLENPESLVPGRQLTLVPDASLAHGDCIVEVAACRIDARLDAALQRVREVLGQ